MFRISLRMRMRWVLLSLLVMLAGGLAGCDSGNGGGDVTGGGPAAQPPGKAQPNPTLVVDLDNAGNGVAGLTEFRVIAYDIRGAELERLTVLVGADANFNDLPAGSLQIRTIGLNASGAVLGYSDVNATIPAVARVAAPSLTLTDQVPPPATPGAPFLAFTGLPASFQPGVPYSLEISAFDAQGQLDTNANGSVGLSSSGVSAVMPELGVLFTKGRAVFPSIVFPQGSHGSVTFTASSGGYQAAVSPTIPVR